MPRIQLSSRFPEKMDKRGGISSPLPCPAREPLFDIDEVNRWIRGVRNLEKRGAQDE